MMMYEERKGWQKGDLISLILAIAFHALLALALFYVWPEDEESVAPSGVQAALISADQLKDFQNGELPQTDLPEPESLPEPVAVAKPTETEQANEQVVQERSQEKPKPPQKATVSKPSEASSKAKADRERERREQILAKAREKADALKAQQIQQQKDKRERARLAKIKEEKAKAAEKKRLIEQQRQRDAEAKKAAEAKEVKRLAAMKAEQAKKEKADEERKRKAAAAAAAKAKREALEAQEQQARNALAAAAGAEDEMLSNRPATLSNNKIDFYKNIVVSKTERNWTRPKSSQAGDRARVNVSLSRAGKVISARVVSSKGDAAFRDSVVQAVKKAEGFPELAELSDAQFNKYFKNFDFNFRPK